MRVAAFGQPTIYGARGSYQLVVREVRADGEGLWRLAFERLKNLLGAEGLLDPDRKRSLPRVPARIGIVTSRSGAALRDVITVVRRRAPWARLLISDCRVQGEGSADSIVRALDRLVRDGRCDVIVLTRGGGSVEDLWAFNEEVVARAIADCPVPTVSAVGHEIDVTISDLVADVRAATPSVAGETVVPDTEVVLASLRRGAGALVNALRRRTRVGRERALHAGLTMHERVRVVLRTRRDHGARLAGRLDALSPLGTIGRGYAVPLDDEGRVMRRVDMFRLKEQFDLRVKDGTVRCTTDSKEASRE
jgi:exodeoxyribonuclease VII large subunit